LPRIPAKQEYAAASVGHSVANQAAGIAGGPFLVLDFEEHVMSIRKSWFSVALALGALVAWVGCGGGNAAPPNALPPSAETGHTEGDGHVHAPGEAHAHPSEGPHHGHLIELGEEEYHAELTHDDATKTVTVYLLDKEAKAPVAIADPEIMLNLVVDGQPTQVVLAAAAQEGDPAGQSSRFSITDEKVLEALEAPKTAGRLNVTIAGKPYVGEVVHHEHGEHKHETP
jgi:hypothetical protein